LLALLFSSALSQNQFKFLKDGMMETKESNMVIGATKPPASSSSKKPPVVIPPTVFTC
jgi:hypothetical protein